MLGLCVNPTNFLFFQEQLCIAYCIKYELNRVTSTPSSFGSFFNVSKSKQMRNDSLTLQSTSPIFSLCWLLHTWAWPKKKYQSILTFSPGMGPRLTRVEILVDPVRPIW